MGRNVSVIQSEQIRQVDNESYLGVMKELILEGKEVKILVSGSSMSPFLIHRRDSVYLGPILRPISVGDIVFYQRLDGSYVLHRIKKVNRDGSYNIIGDAQTEIETDVQREQIFAIVDSIVRKGKEIRPNTLFWKFFKNIWIHLIPFRRFLIALYGKIS